MGSIRPGDRGSGAEGRPRAPRAGADPRGLRRAHNNDNPGIKAVRPTSSSATSERRQASAPSRVMSTVSHRYSSMDSIDHLFRMV